MYILFAIHSNTLYENLYICIYIYIYNTGQVQAEICKYAGWAFVNELKRALIMEDLPWHTAKKCALILLNPKP